MCAWVRCCGSNAPSSKYIYKDGVVNTALSGGLTASGYTLKSNIGVNGNASFNANDITITASFWSSNGYGLGTGIPVDLTRVNSVKLTYEYNNTSRTMVLNTSNLTGSYYLYFAIWDNQWGANYVGIGAGSTKTNVLDNASSTEEIVQQSGATSIVMKITEIELI